MTIGSLFSGIGGLELGLEWAGLGPTLWQVEQNEYCCKVLEKHWPDATRHRDVRTVGAANLEPVDVICGGFPCQPFSVAGRRAGQADERHLWPEFARIIRELRPRFVIGENVPGLLTIDDGAVFAGVLGDLAAMGYDAIWLTLRASDVGASHRRERLFVVAYPEREGREGLVQDWQPPRGARTAHPIPCDGVAFSGMPLDDDRFPLRSGNGVSVTMDRERMHALGNAVVPQVGFVVGQVVRRIMETA